MIEKIRELIRLYYAGESTPEQERELERLLRETPDLPSDLQEERELFAAMADARLEERMEATISRLEAEENQLKAPLRRRLLWIPAAAACAAIIFVAVNHSGDTPTSPQLTPEETQLLAENSLRLLANTMHHGSSEAVRAADDIHESTQKALETLKNFNLK